MEDPDIEQNYTRTSDQQSKDASYSETACLDQTIQAMPSVPSDYLQTTSHFREVASDVELSKDLH